MEFKVHIYNLKKQLDKVFRIDLKLRYLLIVMYYLVYEVVMWMNGVLHSSSHNMYGPSIRRDTLRIVQNME